MAREYPREHFQIAPRRPHAPPVRLASILEWTATAMVVAIAVGVAVAFSLNATEARQARRAALAALPAGFQFAGCNEVRARGLDPLYRGERGYADYMDGDNDGIACEPY